MTVITKLIKINLIKFRYKFREMTKDVYMKYSTLKDMKEKRIQGQQMPESILSH